MFLMEIHFIVYATFYLFKQRLRYISLGAFVVRSFCATAKRLVSDCRVAHINSMGLYDAIGNLAVEKVYQRLTSIANFLNYSCCLTSVSLDRCPSSGIFLIIRFYFVISIHQIKITRFPNSEVSI